MRATWRVRVPTAWMPQHSTAWLSAPSRSSIANVRPLPSGIRVGQMRVPLGVIGIIYESRPNVTIDAAGLTLKSGNACILRGGSEAIECNTLLAQLAAEGLVAAGLPAEGVQLVATTDRAAVGALIAMPQHVDIIVPRGGKGLIERLMRESKVPMIKHLDGICHVYVDGAADVEMAVRIADNAKTQRYGVCNAMETLLVAQPIAEAVLPSLGRIYADKGVELRGCPATVALLRATGVDCVAATEDDWSTGPGRRDRHLQRQAARARAGRARSADLAEVRGLRRRRSPQLTTAACRPWATTSSRRCTSSS